MSICDKCPDDGSGDDCLPVHTFSGLGGQNALENVCKWAFDHPEFIVNGGRLLESRINTCNAKLIDICCFIAMPLSRFSDTFN